MPDYNPAGRNPSQILTDLTRERVQGAMGAQPGSAGYYNIPTEVDWGQYYPGSYQLPGGRWIIPGQQTPMGHETDIPRDLYGQISSSIGQGYVPPPALTSYQGGQFRNELNSMGYDTQPGNAQSAYSRVPTGTYQDPFASMVGPYARGGHGGGGNPYDWFAGMGIPAPGTASPGSPQAIGGGGMSYTPQVGPNAYWQAQIAARNPGVPPGGPTAPTPTTNTPFVPNLGTAPNAPGPTVPPGLPSTSGSGPLTMKDPMSVISEIASGNYAWTPNQQGGGGATVPDSVNKMFNPQGQQNKNNYWGDISSQVWQT